jgi:hypothetical protein
MSYGFRAVNNQGTISVDGDSTSYVYLGKTQFNPNIPGRQDIYVHCVGYPLIFFEIFHGVGGTQDGAPVGCCHDASTPSARRSQYVDRHHELQLCQRARSEFST